MSTSEPYNWLYFVGRSGDEGARWLEHYQPMLPLVADTHRALVSFQKRHMDEGIALLAGAREKLDRADETDPSVHAVLERWYEGVLAYYLYCREAFDEADAAMVRAHEAVAAAIGHCRVLVPVAVECHEFRFHRARIARNRLLWEDVREHVGEVRGMMEGRRPFCVLADGTPVGLDDLKAFYTSVPDPTREERDSVASLLDDGFRLRILEQSIRDVYRIPGHVIPYP